MWFLSDLNVDTALICKFILIKRKRLITQHTDSL